MTAVRAAVLDMLLQPPGLNMAHICGKRGNFVGADRRAAAPGAHAEGCGEMRIPQEKGSTEHLAAFNARPPTKLLV